MTGSRLLARPDAVNVAHVVERCRVLGPGERFILWVQGCPLRCPGCHNPQFQPFRDAEWVSVGDLAARVVTVAGIEGVTFVGGEPFAQAQALAAVAQAVRVQGHSVMAYSGFTLEELRAGVMPHAVALLGQLDLLLDGPYRQDLPTRRPWRGSENQRLIALTDRYRDQVALWNRPTGQQFEVHVNSQGELEILGIPPQELLDALPLSVVTGGGLEEGTDHAR